MRRSEAERGAGWTGDPVEGYLDGLLAADERSAFERLLAVDEEQREELLLARRIRDELRALPLPACPPEVTRAVLAEVSRERRAGLPRRLAAWLSGARLEAWRPSLAMALLAMAVVTAAVVGRLPHPEPRVPAASEAEVRRALAEAKWALGYVSELGRSTGRSVRHDVLEARVVAPVQQALGTVLSEPTKRGTDR